MANQAPVRLAREDGPKQAKRFTFTKRQLESLRPGKRQSWVYDEKADGLALVVTPAGHKSFYWCARIEGRYRRVKIGPFPSVTIENARKQAQRFAGQKAEGRNPADEQQEQRRRQAHINTVQGVWEHYRDHHLKPNRSAKTVEDCGYYVKALGSLKTRRLDSIKPGEIKRLHEQLSERGEYYANRVVGFLRTLFNHAADELDFEGANPVQVRTGRKRRRQGEGKAVAVNRARSRQRYLEKREVPALAAALEAEPDRDFADLIWLLLFTGQRRGNVQSMQWSQISMSRGVWVVPAEAAKAGEPITVPLCSQAMAIVKRRHEAAAEGDVYVFPSARAKSGHIEEPKNRWLPLRKRAGLDDLTLHDLRRSTGSWAAMAAVPYPVIKSMLGHADGGDVTAVYSRVDTESVREGFERTAKALIRASRIGMTLANVKDSTRNGVNG